MFDSVLSHQPPVVDDPNGCIDAVTRAKVAGSATAPAPTGLSERLPDRKKSRGVADRISAENLKKVSDAGLTVAMGTDAGNPLTLHGPSVYAEMEAMQAAGLTPMQVIVASTRGGATAMGVEKEAGTVEKGKSADLLLVAGDPTKDVANLRKVRYVVRGGVVRSIEELKATVAAADEPKK